MKRYAFFFLIALCASHQCLCQIDCSKDINLRAINQKVRERTYEYIKLLKASDLSEKEQDKFAPEYLELQTAFNDIYGRMKDDKANFASKKLICNRYASQLDALIKKDNSYVEKIKKKLYPDDGETNFGVSDILDIIDWLWKKFSDGGDNFYSKVKWDSWTDIKVEK